jgi:Leucine-rich repeat (LRR) protein
MKIAQRIILFFILITIAHRSKAQTWVIIPDYNFRSYLTSIVPSAMAGSSLNITSTLVTIGTQTINCNSHVISNLSGIQYFSSLTYLNCGANYLTSLPTLPNSITYLDCSANQLTSLPALPNSLQYLHCEYNPVGAIPVIPNSLLLLHCEYNGLSTLPNLPNSLDSLYCFNNFLTTLPTLPNSLKYLDCNSNSLNSFPTLPNTLTYLDCSNNRIKCFPFFPSAITQVSLSFNQFNCLPNYVLPAMNAYTNTPLCMAGNTNGCAVASGIEMFNTDNDKISLYPNPSNGQINIKQFDKSEPVNEINIYNNLGQVVFSKKVSSLIETIDTSLPKGIYFYSLSNDSKQTFKNKLIVE